MMSSGRGKAPTTQFTTKIHRSHPTTKSNGTTKSNRSQPTTKSDWGEATIGYDGNRSEAAKDRHQVQHVGCPHRHPEEAVRGFGALLWFQDPRGHGSLLRFQEPCMSSVLAAGHHARISKKSRIHAHFNCAAPAALNINVASKCSATLTVRHRTPATNRATASAAPLREANLPLE